MERVEIDLHECDTERLLDFRLFQLREEIAAFDAQLAAWLRQPADASSLVPLRRLAETPKR
jgi:hypothetical protein